MLHTPTREALRDLLREGAAPFLSLHLAGPESRGFAELEALQGRFRAARARLSVWMRERDATHERDASGPARVERELERLQPPLADLPQGPWTFVAFVDARNARAFVLHARQADDLCAGDVPVLLPALGAARRERAYRVLALSNQRVALFEGSGGGLHPSAAEEVPRTLEEALGRELRKKEQLQHHGHPGGSGSTIYHGQGGAPDERHVDLQRFHRTVAKAVEQHWNGREDPLVLVADETHQGRFRALAHLHGLLEEGVHANAAHLDAAALHERCRPLVAAELERRTAASLEQLGHSRRARHVVAGLVSAAEAASTGRVARLWIEEPAPAAEATHVRAPTAADRLVADVLRHGGSVEVLDREQLPAGPFAELRG